MCAQAKLKSCLKKMRLHLMQRAVRIMDKLSQVFCLLSGIKKMMVSKSKSSTAND